MHQKFTTPPGYWIMPKCAPWLGMTQLKSSKNAWIVRAVWTKSIMTGVLLVKAHAHDNFRLSSYHDNSFCKTIITLLILLHITTSMIWTLWLTWEFPTKPFRKASKQVRYCNNMDDTCTEMNMNQIELELNIKHY